MEKNKPGAYLKYAIGEIILVVIGILIALQINDRNEYNKAQRNSEVYINEIANDLGSDTLLLKRILTNLEIQITKEKWFLSKTAYTINDLDSLKMLLPIGTWDFYINDRTYDKIQSSEASKLTGFDQLYESLTDYYGIDRKRIERNTAFEIREASKQLEVIGAINKIIEMNVNKTRDISGFVIGADFPESPQSEDNKNEFIALMNTN